MTDGERRELDERVGRTIGRYTITRVLGRGGMGAVYEARHARLGRRVAIKFLLPELALRADVLRRFENEAVAAGGLEHPNLVAVIDFGHDDDVPFLVMEFLDGEDGSRLVRRLGALPVTRAVNIVLQACRGVAVAHDAGIVHRDLKPENLFLTDPGDGSDHVKVLDFGIAKLRPADGEALTRTGSTFGTTHYMSPEQARGAGEVDARTDVWSLGVVLYELLAGRKPFEGDQPLNVVHQILNATPPALATLRPGLPRGLVAVVERAMQKDTAGRFPSVRAFANALEPFAGRAPALAAGAATGAPAPTAASALTPFEAPRARGRAAGTIFAVLGVVVAIVIVSIVGTRGKVREVSVPAPELAPAPTPVAQPVTAVAHEPSPAPRATEPEKLEPAAKVDHAERRHVVRAAPSEPAPPPAAPAPAAGKPSVKLDPNPY
ncbi:MAG TPA: protein kinase [Polyangia bacterium]|nr:protein kinase [Polyangia bacterium]